MKRLLRRVDRLRTLLVAVYLGVERFSRRERECRGKRIPTVVVIHRLLIPVVSNKHGPDFLEAAPLFGVQDAVDVHQAVGLLGVFPDQTDEGGLRQSELQEEKKQIRAVFMNAVARLEWEVGIGQEGRCASAREDFGIHEVLAPHTRRFCQPPIVIACAAAEARGDRVCQLMGDSQPVIEV